MAQPAQVRRSERNREPLRPYADQQAYDRFHAQAVAEVQRAVREAAATIEPSDSDEGELPYGEGSESEDDEKAQIESGEHRTVDPATPRHPPSRLHS